MGERPFRILGVQQIAVGAPDKAPLRELWIDLLGLTQTGEYRSEAENVDEAQSFRPAQLREEKHIDRH